MKTRPDLEARDVRLIREGVLKQVGGCTFPSATSKFSFCQSFDIPASRIHHLLLITKDHAIVECFSVHWTAYWISALDPIYTLSSDFRVVVLTVRFNLLPKVFLSFFALSS